LSYTGIPIRARKMSEDKIDKEQLGVSRILISYNGRGLAEFFKT
jgi:hypothetical protein